MHSPAATLVALVVRAATDFSRDYSLAAYRIEKKTVFRGSGTGAAAANVHHRSRHRLTSNEHSRIRPLRMAIAILRTRHPTKSIYGERWRRP